MIMIILKNQDLKKAKYPSFETQSETFITFELIGNTYSVEEAREGYFIKILKNDTGKGLYLSDYFKNRFEAVKFLNDLLEPVTMKAI